MSGLIASFVERAEHGEARRHQLCLGTWQASTAFLKARDQQPLLAALLVQPELAIVSLNAQPDWNRRRRELQSYPLEPLR
jgi:hypothetical protein